MWRFIKLTWPSRWSRAKTSSSRLRLPPILRVQNLTQCKATVGLTADMQEGISTLFLLEDPRTFAETCGSLAGEGQTRQQAWSDCPALAAMDFSQYDAQAGQSLSGQQVMSRYTLACREDFKQLTPQHQAGIALFDQLTGQAG